MRHIKKNSSKAQSVKLRETRFQWKDGLINASARFGGIDGTGIGSTGFGGKDGMRKFAQLLSDTGKKAAIKISNFGIVEGLVTLPKLSGGCLELFQLPTRIH